jgi:hypothetical protein
MFRFALERFCSTISSMIRSTVFGIQLSSTSGADIANRNGLAAHSSARERSAKCQGKEDK